MDWYYTSGKMVSDSKSKTNFNSTKHCIKAWQSFRLCGIMGTHNITEPIAATTKGEQTMAKGSVRKKGKKWYYRFYVEDESGNRVQKEPLDKREFVKLISTSTHHIYQ